MIVVYGVCDMNMIEDAYELLYGEKCRYSCRVKYSGRFKDYGANCSLYLGVLEFGMSKKWTNISKEIQIGLVQELMLKLFKHKKRKVKTMMYVDLYNNFVKNLHIAVPKNNVNPVLKKSFDRINEEYFLGLVEMPNLIWGNSLTTLGSYEFKADTVTMSRVLSSAREELLDYVMFHEIRNKQRKFERRGSKTSYHDSKFKRLESVFKDRDRLEKELNRLVSRARTKRVVRNIFRLS